jgi:predicted site-specific integrase-resolvase
VKDELLSPEGAGARLGVSPRSIQLWVKQGKLPAVPIIGADWIVVRASDLEKTRERPKPGPKPKKGKK